MLSCDDLDCENNATTSSDQLSQQVQCRSRRKTYRYTSSNSHIRSHLTTLQSELFRFNERRRLCILFVFAVISLCYADAVESLGDCRIRRIDSHGDETDDGKFARLECPSPASLTSLNETALNNVTQLLIQCTNPIDKTAATVIPTTNFPRLQRLVAHGCGEDGIRALRSLRHGQLARVDLASNSIQNFEWLLARSFNTKVLDLSKNNIFCTCTNRWIFDSINSSVPRNYSIIEALQLPHRINYLPGRQARICPSNCPIERTDLQPQMVNTKMDSQATLQCSFDVPFDQSPHFNPTDVFGWLMDTEEARQERSKRWNITIEDTTTVNLQIRNLNSTDLGMVVCRCLHCVGPSFAVSELRFDTPISSNLYVRNEKDVEISLHGYPLENLTMIVTRLNDNVTETREMHDDGEDHIRLEFFNGTLVSRYEIEHSMAFLKYFSLFVKECSTCERHEQPRASDYEILVCTPRENDCTQIQTSMGHRVHIPYAGEDSKTRAGANAVAYFFLILVIVCTIGGLILSTFHYYYRRDKTASKLVTAVGWHKKGRRYRRTSRNTMRTEETSLRDDTLSATLSNYSLQHVPIIEREHLILEEAIGKGQFGEVFTGEWLARGVQVAIKTLHNIQVDATMDKEAAMLAALEHDNVVKMYGICKAPEQQGLYLVLELMNMGDLKTYVKQRQPQCDNYSQFPPALLPTELINIAQQVCTGLSYITSQQIVHRDLAARNCLVSGESDVRLCSAAFRPPITVKISDFGMSRRLYSQAEYYKMGDKHTALPVRWLPPECLEAGRFTHQSDMWSFGVTLYEIFTYGAMPYGDLSNNEALMAVISGVRPTVPPKCPAEIGELMKDCWKTAPDERPVAEDALVRLKMIQ
ncbi:hypothetical protein M3Y94_00724200 [Aphelenchoides besseyi]|nr:hypothetical protein M3Y94_00724200 [Aphelenchoides besseyi]KAI6231824.1 hypothetical protein M3Y95_00422000 [Aphelenchoides besseyi]